MLRRAGLIRGKEIVDATTHSHMFHLFRPRGRRLRRRSSSEGAACVYRRGFQGRTGFRAHSSDARGVGAGMKNGKNYKGSCFCGAVQFTVAGEPAAMGYCHCESCRTWSAGPVNAFTLWKPEAVRITRGAGEIAGYAK